MMLRKWILPLMLIVMSGMRAAAQGCSVCTQTANQLSKNGAEGLNMGIVYLAFLPITLITVLGIVWWRNNHRVRN